MPGIIQHNEIVIVFVIAITMVIFKIMTTMIYANPPELRGG